MRTAPDQFVLSSALVTLEAAIVFFLPLKSCKGREVCEASRRRATRPARPVERGAARTAPARRTWLMRIEVATMVIWYRFGKDEDEVELSLEEWS